LQLAAGNRRLPTKIYTVASSYDWCHKAWLKTTEYEDAYENENDMAPINFVLVLVLENSSHPAFAIRNP
jgi:hypothetical protein